MVKRYAHRPDPFFETSLRSSASCFELAPVDRAAAEPRAFAAGLRRRAGASLESEPPEPLESSDESLSARDLRLVVPRETSERERCSSRA